MIRFDDIDSTCTKLSYMKPAKQGFWQIDHDPVISLENVTTYPMSMIKAERFLLLGADDDEKMRLLVIPSEGRAPEIKPFSLTLAEA